jgi:ribosomal-protein-alanine N-acetyltransferase
MGSLEPRSASKPALPIAIDPMTEGDLDAVLEIERVSFSSPWSRRMFESELLGNPFAFSFVVRHAGSIVGYLCFWIVFDELHLLNLAVAPRSRRSGIGEEAVRWALAFGRARGAGTATLEVRASNHPARRLYEKLGFKSYAVRKNYYSDPPEDALLLRFNAAPSDPNRLGTPQGGFHEQQPRPGADPKIES